MKGLIIVLGVFLLLVFISVTISNRIKYRAEQTKAKNKSKPASSYGHSSAIAADKAASEYYRAKRSIQKDVSRAVGHSGTKAGRVSPQYATRRCPPPPRPVTKPKELSQSDKLINELTRK